MMAQPQPPGTRLTLIRALRNGLRWEEFLALYGRLILFWAREFGLQPCDAENVQQEVLFRVWRSLAGYEPARGRFRAWLYTCTRNAVFNLWRGRRGEGQGRPLSTAHEPWRAQPDTVPAVRDGDLEGALQGLEEQGFALESLEAAVARVRTRVRPSSWKAFLLFEFFELKARDIAPRLGMTPAAVNQAVYRIRQLLQETLDAPPTSDPRCKERRS
jgi:RNA polymerase sigma-70 factor (ECF subfamily)